MAAIVVVAVAAYAALGSDVFALFKSNDYVLAYVKESGLYFKGQDFKESVKVTSDISENFELFTYGDSVDYQKLNISDDKKTMFYVAGEDYTGPLYYRSVNEGEPTNKDASAEGVRIANDVTYFTMLQGGKSLLYYKEGNSSSGGHDIYYFDMKNSYKLDSNVVDFRISEDENKLAVLKNKNSDDYSFDLYTVTVSSETEKEKIDSQVTRLVEWDANLDIFVYEKDSSNDDWTKDLYINKNGNKEKVASQVNTVYGVVFDKGNVQVLYSKNRTEEISIMEFIDDDMSESDAGVHEPTYDEFTEEVLVEGYFYDYIDRVTDYEAYNAAYDRYLEKIARDNVRNSEPFSFTYSDLYQYDSENKESLLAENISEVLAISTSDNQFDVVYLGSDSSSNSQGKNKVKISDWEAVMGLYDQIEYANTALNATDCIYLSNGVKTTLMDISDQEDPYYAMDVRIYKDSVYILERDKDSNTGTLYLSKISEDKAGVPTVLAEEVNYYKVEDDLLLALKGPANEYEDHIGELYVIDKEEKKIGDDVNWYSVEVLDNNALTFVAHTSTSDPNGDLMKYKSGKTEKITNFVFSYYYLADDSMYVIKDYDTEEGAGDLHYFNGKELESIDRGVRYFRVF